MPDKNLVISVKGTPSEDPALITRKKKVSFFPADSDHKVFVRFIGVTGEVPFSDWDSTSNTGKKGRALTGKVRTDLEKGDSFQYVAKSVPAPRKVTRDRGLAPPQLIVDGGRLTRSATSRAKATRKK